MLRFGHPPYLECSSRGDKRFSAFYAKPSSGNGKSIEELYQASKKFRFALWENEIKTELRGADLPLMEERLDLSSLRDDKHPYRNKDIEKFSRCNKLIARGSESSSTALYAKTVDSSKVNQTDYKSSDVVGISAEGNRNDAIAPDFILIQLAMDAGVIIITDDRQNRERPYNTGERRVADFLETNGYREIADGGGVWFPTYCLGSGRSIKYAKGKHPINYSEVQKYYENLWREYINEHPELLAVLQNATGLSDIFGQPGCVCQAEVLWKIRNESLQNEEE
jgi:hypothetical protein